MVTDRVNNFGEYVEIQGVVCHNVLNPVDRHDPAKWMAQGSEKFKNSELSEQRNMAINKTKLGIKKEKRSARAVTYYHVYILGTNLWSRKTQVVSKF